MIMNKVNVLMCVYKEEFNIVRQAVESITQQTYNNIELIVVIDNPDRLDIVEFLDQSKTSYSIKYVLNEKNIGLTQSLNIGLQLCDAPFVARMDADDVAMPDRIENQMEFLLSNHCDLVGGYIQLIDENSCVIHNRTNYPVHDEAIKRMLLLKDCIPHPTWLFRREMAMKLQGYREVYAAEDYDFLIRAMLSGAKFGVLPQICLQYRVNRRGITQNNLALQKVLTGKIVDQYRNRTIYTTLELEEYVARNHKVLQKKEHFYHCVKKRKKKIVDLCDILFSTTLLAEIRERVAERVLLAYDKCMQCYRWQ